MTAALEDRDAAELVRLVTRVDLPAAFERWQVVLAPRSQRATAAREWAGTLVLVERGRLEIGAPEGARHVFVAGDVLVLGWLPVHTLRNPGATPLRLVVVRRRGDRPTAAGLLRVIRHIRR